MNGCSKMRGDEGEGDCEEDDRSFVCFVLSPRYG